MAIYCKFGDVAGDVSAKGFEGQFTVQSFNVGFSRGISMESGNVANRESTRTSCGEVTITKLVDASAVKLFHKSVGGGDGDKASEVIFSFVQTGGTQVVTYLEVKLEGAIISSYSISGDAEGQPSEVISISYNKVEYKYIQHDENNKIGTQIVHGFDLKTGLPS